MGIERERKDFLKPGTIKQMIYPSRCPMCDIALKPGTEGFCQKCFSQLSFIEKPVCEKCGRPVSDGNVFCGDCLVTAHEFEAGRFVFSYEQMAGSIYRFKYMNRPAYAKTYALETVKRLSGWLDEMSPDAFIPVPLFKKRLIERGYNQSEELAKALSKLTHIPTMAHTVERIRNTQPQKLMGIEGRRINVKKAFIVKENVVKLTTVVIVDDIFTTGSTIDSLAAELKANGVKHVFFLTISGAGT